MLGEIKRYWDIEYAIAEAKNPKLPLQFGEVFYATEFQSRVYLLKVYGKIEVIKLG